MDTLIAAADLAVHFPIKRGVFSRTDGYVQAVDGITLSLKKGRNLGIVGESGCGKTTAGLAMMGLIRPTGGRVYYRGEDMAVMSRSNMKDLRRSMQLVFQDPYSSLNPRMTVNQILSDPMDIHGLYKGSERQDRICYLLNKIGLVPEHGQRYPHEFSGGQRQRIGIARALAVDPKIIIGDEPVSALDVSIQAQIINLLIDIQKEFHLSYLVISHDLAVVEHICDEVAVIYLGRIVEMGDYRDVYTNPRHPYTQALFSAVPTSDPDRTRRRIILKGDVPSPINPPAGCRFHPRCPKKMNICCDQDVELKQLAGGHQVACHLYLETDHGSVV